MDSENLYIRRKNDPKNIDEVNEQLQNVDSAIAANKESEERFLSSIGREAKKNTQEARNSHIVVNETAGVSQKKADTKEKLFAAREKVKNTNLRAQRIGIADVLKEVHGLDNNANVKRKAALSKKIASKVFDRIALRDKMSVTIKKFQASEVDFEKINELGKKELEGKAKDFDNFKYSKLLNYKTDKDFQKNYIQIMNDLERRIEDGYAARRLYFENNVNEKLNEKGLVAMAKTATLERIKEYMQLRAELISNTYYAVNDSKALFSLSVEALENRLNKARNNVNKPNPVLEAFLTTLISIKLLGFNPDGTGRREIEAKILEENRDAWEEIKSNVYLHASMQNELKELEEKRSRFGKLGQIYTNQKLQEEKEQAKQAKIIAANEAVEKEKIAKMVKAHREEWLGRIEELSKKYNLGINSEVFKENVLRHIAGSFLNGELKGEDNQKFLAVLKLFEKRILEKSLEIETAIEKDDSFNAFTFGLQSRKDKIKMHILESLSKQDKLLAGEYRLDMNQLMDEEFVQKFSDEKMKTHYYDLVLRFPYLAKDRRVWDLAITEKFLSLDDAQFEVEVMEMKHQANFYDSVIRSKISEAVDAGKININIREKVYKEIKKRLGADVYLAPIGQVVLETERYLNEVDLLHLVGLSDYEGWIILEDPSPDKWKKKQYRNPVEAIKESIFAKAPALRDEFENSSDIAEYVFDAMSNCSAVIAKYPVVAGFENVGDVAKLNYRELKSIVSILCDNVIASSDIYMNIKGVLPIKVKKYTLGKMMASALTEAEMLKVVDEGKKKHEEESRNQEQDRHNLIASLYIDSMFDKKLAYNYRFVEGTQLFGKTIAGINVRTADFKVGKRFERVKIAERIWADIDSQGDALRVLHGLLSGGKADELVADPRIKDCVDEFMLLGVGKEILGTDGLGEDVAIAYSDSDYKKGLKKFNYLYTKFILIEEAVDQRYENARGANIQNKKVTIKKNLRKYAARFKNVSNADDTANMLARKYNKENFGFETFEEALGMFLNSNDANMEEEGFSQRDKIQELADYSGGVLKPIMSMLLSKKQIMRGLFAEGTNVSLFAEDLVIRFAPLLSALDKKKHPAYVIEQYLNNNAAIIFNQCMTKPLSEKEWGATLDEYAKLLYKTEIEGRGTIQSLIDDAIAYAQHLEKGTGGFRFINMIELHPELFNLIVEDTDALNKEIKDRLANCKKNLATIDAFLKENGVETKKRADIKLVLEGKLIEYVYENVSDDVKQAEYLDKIGEEYNKYIAAQNLVDRTKEAEQKRESQLNIELLDGFKDVIRTRKEAGIDEDFKLLLEMEKATNLNPYIYLASKGIVHGETTGSNKKEKYTVEQAKKCRKKVDDCLKEMRHTEELPENLKRFMAEVAFAEKKVNLNNELRYIIGLYRAMSVLYKYSSEQVAINVQEIIERAVVYHYVSHTDHSIDEKGEMFYKHAKTVEEDNQANPQPANDPGNVQANAPANAQQANDPANAQQVNAPANAQQANAQPANAPAPAMTDEEILREYFGDKYKDANLNEEAIAILKDYKEKQEKKAKAAGKKAVKAAEKQENAEKKKVLKAEKYEASHKEYLIPKLNIVNLANDTKVFDRVYKKNTDLHKLLKEKVYNNPEIIAEFKFFVKNIQLLMYTMPEEEFTAFVDRRLKYFDHAQKVYELIEAELLMHYQIQNEKEIAQAEVENRKSHLIEGDHNMELAQLHEFFRAQINEEVNNGVAFDANSWKEQMKQVLDNRLLHKAVRSESVAYDDNEGRVRFYADQNRLYDISLLIRNSKNKEAITQYKALKPEEKLLFAAALSVATNTRNEGFDPSCGFIEKDGNSGYDLESIMKGFAEYVKGNKANLNIDYSMALSNLYVNKENEQSVLDNMISGQQKAVLNMDVFRSAMAIVEAARMKRNMSNGLDLLTLGNSSVSLVFAAKHSRAQAYEAQKRTNKDMDAFMANLTELALKDSERTGSRSIKQKGQNFGHDFKRYSFKKTLITRMTNMTDEEKHLFVMLMQDRTVLDYKSEKREETFENGGIITHVNEDKRALIKAAYLANARTRGNLLLPADSTKALNNAMRTLLSFQLRDSVEVDGTKEIDYVQESINRTTLMDWDLIKAAFIFIDEMKRDAARINAVKKSSDWIEESGNAKAIAAYKEHKSKDIKTFDQKSFEDFLKSAKIKDEIEEKQKAMIDGFMLLTDAQKVLFFRALENRDILDISKKNSVKNIMIGSEREYVNIAGRYELLDEYIARARSDKAEIRATEGMYYNAVKSLLSTQVNDDINFLNATEKEIKDLIASEGFFASSRRKTAIDWELFENALQFVTRADNEAQITYEDEDLYRTLGNLESNGNFNFNPTFLRRCQAFSSGSRFVNYASSRIRSRVKDYIPDTGNLRIILSYILNAEGMNAVNRSGLIAKKGTTGTINEKYVNVYKAEKLAEENVKTKAEIAVMQEACDKVDKETMVYQAAYDTAQNALNEAKENKSVTKEELAKLQKERDTKLKALKEQKKVAKALYAKKGKKDMLSAMQEGKIKLLKKQNEKIAHQWDVPEDMVVIKTGLKQASINGLDTGMAPSSVQIEKGAKFSELTKEQIEGVFKEHTGLAKYSDMSNVLENITKGLKKNSDSKKLTEYIEALKKSKEAMAKAIESLKTNELLKDNIIEYDIDTIFGMAIVLANGEEQNKEVEKIKQIYENVQEIKGNIQKVFNDFAADVDMLEMMSETEITGLVNVIGRYTETVAFERLKEAASDNSILTKKIEKIVTGNQSYMVGGANQQDAIKAGVKNRQMATAINVDSMCMVVSDLTTYLTQKNKGEILINATKTITDNTIDIVKDVLKAPEAREKLKQQIETATAKFKEDKKAFLEKIEAETDDLVKTELKKELETFEKGAKEEIESLEKTLRLSIPNEIIDTSYRISLADAGRIISVFLSDENAQLVEKRSHQLEFAKSQITELYRQFCTYEETSQLITQFNLDMLMMATNLEDKDSKVYKTGKVLAGGASVIRNGFKIYLKNIDGEQKINGVKVRNKGESKTEKFDEYGDLQSRTATDVLDQLGIDEAFEVVKVVAMLDKSGKTLKYVAATQQLKTQVASYIDSVNKVIKENNYDNIKEVTDIDGCVMAVQNIMALNDTTGKYAPLLDSLNQTVSLKREITGLYETMTSDKDMFEKLSEIRIDNLMSLMGKFDKDGFVNTMKSILSEAKRIYGASYGLYQQGRGFAESMRYFFTFDKPRDLINESVENLYNRYKDIKGDLVGDKVKKWYESGTLTNMYRGGYIVRNGIVAFMDSYKAITGLKTLTTEGRGIDVEFKDVDDLVGLEQALKKQNEAISGDDFKMTEAEKAKIMSARDRNLFMTKEGVKNATVNESMEIVAGVMGNIVIDPAGLAADIFKETAEFIKFLARVFTDYSTLNNFFKNGPGKEKVAKIKELYAGRGEDIDDSAAVEKAKYAMGLSDTMELRTYVGRNIVSSILYSASNFNPLEGTKSRAVAVLKALRLDSIIGHTDEGAAMKLYNALLGNYGIDLVNPTPTNVFKGDEKLDDIYGFNKRPTQTQAVVNGLMNS